MDGYPIIHKMSNGAKDGRVPDNVSMTDYYMHLGHVIIILNDIKPQLSTFLNISCKMESVVQTYSEPGNAHTACGNRTLKSNSNYVQHSKMLISYAFLK